ncbi:alcohol dehydrogenase catalytic domain-containing protein [Lentzea sp. HUAS12]|uniref:alcohol dehydrogenase catalytic domain-containing protein n=1 Tax=Lentzea sp. HUAS12 TaxID=2951806 RepID=UPI0020A0CD3D|nr:alcohol dehydrogenase catalytic domain-containing protein [Lentzea sp. HUAS12]USX52937.1 alcohol dehydrogenase catalytic domain-containing protein [Lentzea sp. HUAS12]
MRALTVDLARAGSLSLADLPDPVPGPDELLVEGVAIGICGTDREIVRGEFGVGGTLVIGHESLGRVISGPGFAPGSLVAGVVRRPDPVPCVACARGEFDMCRNGRYTERGITGLDGYGSTLWTVPSAYAVGVSSATGVLVEPASVVVKAWERLDALALYPFDSVLVTGAGPIGLLAALVGVQRGLDVHVFDLASSGPKPGLVESLGATYHRTLPDCPVVIEATGAPSLVARLLGRDLVCLTGVPSTEVVPADVGQINRDLVLRNGIVFGTVNSNVRHYREASAVLDRADDAWLSALITRRVPLESYAEAFEHRPDDVKVVLEL